MPNHWWACAEDVADQIENIEHENKALLQKVECLEINIESLNKSTDNLHTLLAAMQPPESSSSTSPIAQE